MNQSQKARAGQFLSKALIFTVVLTASFLTAAAQESFYTVRLFAVDNVDILDEKGSVLRPLSPFAGLVLREVQYDPGTTVAEAEEERRTYPNRSLIWSPHEISFSAKTAAHEIRFTTTGSSMMHFEIRRARASNPEDADLLIRYTDNTDLGIPAGVNARITFTPTSVSDLQLDRDRNGSYETIVRPQFRVTGLNAKDEEGPRVTMDATVRGKTATITVTATDPGSGVKNIQYQIGNGNPNHSRYTAPFNVDVSQTVWVFAIADDMAGNRAMRYKVFEGGIDTTGKHPIPGPFDPLPQDPNTVTKEKALGPDPFQLKSKPF